MLRYLRYLVLGAIALVLIIVALANRTMVTLNTLPEVLTGVPGLNLLAFSIEMPLFVVIFLGVAGGVLVGYILEWLREHKHRVAMRSGDREVSNLKREVQQLKGKANEGKDDVLALLDDAT